jgi:hypothetical protein
MADQKFKSKVRIQGGIAISTETAERALIIDASGDVKSSSVTDVELGRLSGISDNIQDQLDDKIESSEKGAANGVVPLNGSSKIDATYLPSYVDDVLEYADFASLPAEGETGKIYVTLDDNKAFRWSGSVYLEISPSEVVSVNGQTSIVVLDTDDIDEGSTNLYFTEERAQDAVAAALIDSSSIDFTYDDVENEITAVVLPAGVDHDQLQNFVADEHVDHSAVEIETAANSGLSGGGDITATRSLVVDITGTTLETSVDSADEILIYDVSASARRKTTVGDLLDGIALGSEGDIPETSFAMANDQSTAANVTGFTFSNTVVRSFRALVSIEIDADADTFEMYDLIGINKGGTFEISQSAVGDDSGVVFSITAGGQIQYTSTDNAGFVSGSIKFRAETTSV